MSHEDKYREEISLGIRAEAAYNTFIKQFIESKKVALYENFCSANPIDDIDCLLETRRLYATIVSLENEILSTIQTGKLAAKSLEDTK